MAASSTDVFHKFKAYIDELEKEIQEARDELLKEKACAKQLQLHSEDHLDILLQNKMK